MTPKEKREQFFAQAIAHQKNGEYEDARLCAGQCLGLLEPIEGSKELEEVAAGQVVRLNGQTICLPDYLHSRTALQRFRAEGIKV